MPVIPTILSELSRLAERYKRDVIPSPLSNVAFTFDSLGVAGFFGGDSSVTAMATVALTPRYLTGFLGWYNAPGSLDVAKQYARLLNVQIGDSLFPAGRPDPTRLLELDGDIGPKFVAAHSGVVLDFTGHPGSLIRSWAEVIDLTHSPFHETHGAGGTGQNVTIINLQHNNHFVVDPERAISFPSLSMNRKAVWSLAPMSVSVGACVLCALTADWPSFASIAVGMVAHGLACLIIGSGKLTFKSPKPAEGAPPGDGVLVGERDVIVLVGPGGAVNAITRGRFFYNHKEESNESPPFMPFMLSTPSTAPPVPPSNVRSRYISSLLLMVQSLLRSRTMLWISALLLMAQPLLQLFLIPLGTLFGQLMFIATIITSWAYNMYLSHYVDRHGIQTGILFKMLSLERSHIQKYQLKTLTSAIAFTFFVLASVRKLDDPLAFLDGMLPNNTVWKVWKEAMARKLKDRRYFDVTEPKELLFDEDLTAVEKRYRNLLEIYFKDAQDAWKAWCVVRNNEQMLALRPADATA